MLFFWWSICAPNLPSMDNAWWWTGIAIRIAQEDGFHREQRSHQFAHGKTAGLCRRIWWTFVMATQLTIKPRPEIAFFLSPKDDPP
ncbi:hypothetical protein N7449_011878 [Penicillium cf. viridicatum]|uniref:Transcription factor domain-containing protein n=1 Tax=Penicillium cf. viridicatum TaxID=2972119 RepID=A0A9W9IQU2_9EURO|nr:hypothetical protein N7449_011878 [Penicillium cf. viridicatum]